MRVMGAGSAPGAKVLYDDHGQQHKHCLDKFADMFDLVRPPWKSEKPFYEICGD